MDGNKEGYRSPFSEGEEIEIGDAIEMVDANIDVEEIRPDSVKEFVETFKIISEHEGLNETQEEQVRDEISRLEGVEANLNNAKQKVPEFITEGIKQLTDILIASTEGLDVGELDVDEEDLLQKAA